MDTACPNLSVLKRILAAPALERDETLERHIDACAACQRRLDELSEGSSVLERMRDLVEEADLLAHDAPRRLGDCELLRVIGRGGMGVVWEADQISLKRRVAVKVLSWERSLAKGSVERFRREAEAGARIRHEGIVSVLGVGEHEGQFFLVQELVENGRNLGDLLGELREASELPADHYRSCAQLFAQLGDALHAAHEQGVIHRDVKPTNVLLTAAGQPKIADFGLARVHDALGLSETGQLLGTPFYMSPEQARSRAPLDRRTDVFSLGATLYEALTLRRPFEGDTSHQVLAKIAIEDPPDPRDIRSLVPRDLATICLKALEKEPSKRYATARALAEDLRRFLHGRSILARPTGPLGRTSKWCRRHPVASVSGAILIASFAVISTLYVQLLASREVASLARDEAQTFSEVASLARLDLAEAQLDLLDSQKELIATGESASLGYDATWARAWVRLAETNALAGRLEEAADSLRRSGISADELEELADSPVFRELRASPFGGVLGDEALAARREREARVVQRARRNARAGDRDMAERALADPIVSPKTRSDLAGSADFAWLEVEARAMSEGASQPRAGLQEITVGTEWLEPLWARVVGTTYGVTFDPATSSLVTSRIGAKAQRFGLDGSEREALMVSKDAQRFLPLPGSGGEPERFIGTKTWAHALETWRVMPDGSWEPSWMLRHELAGPIDDVAVGDVDGDGQAEVAVVYNVEGVELFDARGQSLWSRPGTKGKAVRIVGDRILVLNGRSLVELDASGRAVESTKLPHHATRLESLTGVAPGITDRILVAGRAGTGVRVALVQRDGTRLWSTTVEGAGPVTSLVAGPRGLVAATGGTSAFVLDGKTGALLARCDYPPRERASQEVLDALSTTLPVAGADRDSNARVPSVWQTAWVETDGELRLFVASDGGLFAYRVTLPR